MSPFQQAVAAIVPIPEPFTSAGVFAVCAAIAFTFMGAVAGVLVWAERKICARMQSRRGPVHVGGKFGWLQSIADGIKLVLKEDIIPDEADKPVFRLAPYLVIAGTFLAFAALPFSDRILIVDLDVGIFFILAVSALSAVGILLGGWASNSKWSLYGAAREVAQVVSYEIPLTLAVLPVVIAAGSLSLRDIVAAQAGSILNWHLFSPFMFICFFIFFTAGLASLGRAPFDLPEAESELVAGFFTEYSGIRFSYFFLAEYGGMFLISGVASALFLGGWHLGPYSSAWIFLAKTSFLLFVMIWVRWSLPRLRIDQVMYVCWKVLTPFAMACVLGQAFLAVRS